MTTTEAGSEHFDADGNSILDWAKALYPGGYEMNGAGQHIRQPVPEPVED